MRLVPAKFQSALSEEATHQPGARRSRRVSPSLSKEHFQKKKWIPSINRFRTIIDEYDTTIYTEEALHRLVEVYYIIGLENEAEKYAKLLSYNYQSSKWYEQSYSVFNKKYKQKRKKVRKNKVKNNSILKKFSSLFN